MTKWDRIFRIAVVLLLSANLAVTSIICVRLADKALVESSGKKESATEIADADHDIALILSESPTAADVWYNYDWAYEVSDYVEIIRLGTTGSDWHFEMTLPGANADLTVQQIYVNNMVDGQKTTDQLVSDDVIRYMAELNDISGDEVILRAGKTLFFEDWHPFVTEFNGREILFVLQAASGETVRYSYIFELTENPALSVDYTNDSGKDLSLLRHNADYDIKVFDGVYWVPAVSLGESRYTNAEIAAMQKDSPEEKQAKIGTLYEALQLYQIGDFHSADDNVRISENGINWEFHTPGRNAVINNCGCCATDSAWLRYLLDGDYDEIGYITTSQRDGSGHVYNYIQEGEWYYIIDLTHYRNDWIATIEENGDLEAYSRSDRVLGNIHRTKDLASFVNYVQDAFNDPPGLMFRLTCEDVTPIDGVHSEEGVAIVRPESCEPYVTCIFDDDADDLTYAYAPNPTKVPEYSLQPVQKNKRA